MDTQVVQNQELRIYSSPPVSVRSDGTRARRILGSRCAKLIQTYLRRPVAVKCASIKHWASGWIHWEPTCLLFVVLLIFVTYKSCVVLIEWWCLFPFQFVIVLPINNKSLETYKEDFSRFKVCLIWNKWLENVWT